MRILENMGSPQDGLNIFEINRYDGGMHERREVGELKNQTFRPEDQMDPGSLAERRHQDTSCDDKPQYD
jgi:hypothetical protein